MQVAENGLETHGGHMCQGKLYVAELSNLCFRIVSSSAVQFVSPIVPLPVFGTIFLSPRR